VWGVLAAAATAAVLLAALALALDFTAVASAHSDVQSALDTALRSASHEVRPASIASATPSLSPTDAIAAADAVLSASLPQPIGYAWSAPPSVLAGPPSAITATLLVTVQVPALLGRVSFPVHAEEAIGWLPR
jgi:hypothetical protein